MLQRPRGPQPLSMSAWLTSWITDQLQTDDGIFQKFSHRVVLFEFPPIFHFRLDNKIESVASDAHRVSVAKTPPTCPENFQEKIFRVYLLFSTGSLNPNAHFKSVHTS